MVNLPTSIASRPEVRMVGRPLGIKTFKASSRRPAKDPVVVIEVVSHLAGLRALGEEWNGLAKRFASPFLSHGFNLACAEAFCESLRPAVHVLRSGGRIAAIAPLALVHGHVDGRRRPGVRRLEMLATFGGKTGGFLYRDEESLTKLLRCLLAGRRPISLSRLESVGVEARLLRGLAPRSSLCVIRDAGTSVWVPLDPSWSAFEARISSKRLRELRRERKRAEELGEVRFEVVAADEGNVDRYLQAFYQVEAAGWKTRAGTAILSVPYMERFQSLSARAAARLGLLRFYFLRIKDEAAAAQLVIDHGNRLWELKAGYDERFRRVSPGTLLDCEILRHACERGYEAVEFLGAVEPYKAVWTDRRHHFCSIRVYPLRSPLGQIALAHDLVAFAGGRAARAIRTFYPRGPGWWAAPPGGAGVGKN
jgi:CelD/BcsL family acetyltransferase involved in cellulose biosynthesis